MRPGKKYAILSAIVVALVVLGGAVIHAPRLVERMHYAAHAGQARAAREKIGEAADLSEAFKQVARSVRPSVVHITSVRRVRGAERPRAPLPPGFDRDPFRDFFGDDFFDRFFDRRAPGPQREFEQRGVGTGVIVREDGYILTNNHVIAQAEEVEVKLSTGATHTAEVVGTDPKTDLAVLKIDVNDLTAAVLGDSGDLEPGEWVLAVGNPFGLEQTVTAGIISAVGRADVGIAEYEDFIQTDAAINPGNSGGPLLNLRGEVIGINTAIVAGPGGFQGIGFAVPITMAQVVMESLIETGEVRRGWLGVLIQDLDEDLAQSFQYATTDGVLIGDVTRDSPAERAGLQSGDIIVEYDGEPVESVHDLRNRVAQTKPEETIEIKVFRDGETRTVEVTIGLLETARGVPERDPAPAELGLSVETLTSERARRLDAEGIEGVVVTAVEPGSPAQQAGVRQNDVILSVNGAAVPDTDTFSEALAQADPQRGIRMRLWSRGQIRFVVLRVR